MNLFAHSGCILIGLLITIRLQLKWITSFSTTLPAYQTSSRHTFCLAIDSVRKRKFVTHFAGHDRPWRRYFSLHGARHAASSRLARNDPASPE